MYSDYPQNDRRRLTALYAAIWLIVALAGVASAVDPGNSVDTAVGRTITLVFGLILGVASIGGALGVITNRYRLEWGSASVALVGAIPYVVASWWILIEAQFGLTRTITGTLLILYPVSRSVACLAHSNRQRARISQIALDTVSLQLPGDAEGRENETHG